MLPTINASPDRIDQIELNLMKHTVTQSQTRCLNDGSVYEGERNTILRDCKKRRIAGTM